MNFAIISGSHRVQSESSKVALFAARRLEAQGHETHVLDLGTTPLPIWDETYWSKSRSEWSPIWAEVAERLKKADGLVVVSPEWSGMVPPRLKNLFLLCSERELAHKPALIIGVTSGRSGSYPIAELRMSSYKNTKICYLPEHVIVRDVTNLLNGDEPVNTDDLECRKRIDYSLELLTLYTQALKPLQESRLVTATPYPFGM
jgi:NAD(P)H-dependent FMN reductase